MIERNQTHNRATSSRRNSSSKGSSFNHPTPHARPMLTLLKGGRVGARTREQILVHTGSGLGRGFGAGFGSTTPRTAYAEEADAKTDIASSAPAHRDGDLLPRDGFPRDGLPRDVRAVKTKSSEFREFVGQDGAAGQDGTVGQDGTMGILQELAICGAAMQAGDSRKERALSAIPMSVATVIDPRRDRRVRAQGHLRAASALIGGSGEDGQLLGWLLEDCAEVLEREICADSSAI